MKAPTGHDRCIVIRIEIADEKFSSLFWPTVTGFRCNSYRGRENYTSSDTFSCIIKFEETIVLMAFKF